MVSIRQRDDQRWAVARTKSRCEKKFADYCQRLAFPCYLPVRRSTRRYKHKVAEFQVPIFQGYVFLQLDPIDKPTLMESRLAADILIPDVLAEAQLIAELNDIRLIETAAQDLKIEVRPEIAVGRQVEVQSGPMMGLHGIVCRRQAKTRIAVNVELVGQSVVLDIDVSEVELAF